MKGFSLLLGFIIASTILIAVTAESERNDEA
jgi:hypothetical protein